MPRQDAEFAGGAWRNHEIRITLEAATLHGDDIDVKLVGIRHRYLERLPSLVSPSRLALVSLFGGCCPEVSAFGFSSLGLPSSRRPSPPLPASTASSIAPTIQKACSGRSPCLPARIFPEP